jgi:type IV secretory pathway VirB2 component (pilin)
LKIEVIICILLVIFPVISGYKGYKRTTLVFIFGILIFLSSFTIDNLSVSNDVYTILISSFIVFPLYLFA